MLVSQDHIVYSIISAGTVINTIFQKGNDCVAFFDLDENCRLQLVTFRNEYSMNLHKFIIGDQQVIEIANTSDVTKVKDAIAELFSNLEGSEPLVREITISFCKVLLDSLLQMQQDEYIAKLRDDLD